MVDKPQKVVIIAGPTAVGKTSLLLKIQESLAQQTQIEVINCDSVQVFRKLNIGSAKPSQELRQQVPHHLIDILNPDEKFTAGDFVRHSQRLIPEIAARQKIPVIAGGTIFYLKSFIYGLSEIPQSKGIFHRELEQLSSEDLQRKLQVLDPNAKIHVNDRQRQIRACEVSLETGRPFSKYKAPTHPRKDYHILIIVLERPRSELYSRIDQRVEEMFSSGLMDELRNLESAGYRNLQGIGYREFFLEPDNPEKLLRTIQQNSRNYAKRQITFLKQLPCAHFYAPEDAEAITSQILKFYQN